MNAKGVVIAVIIVIGVVVIALSIGGSKKPRPMPVIEGVEAPDITLNAIDGNSWQLSANKGKVIFINFWATWCDTCKEEMPSIQRLYDMKKDDPNFLMVTILYDDDPETAVTYLKVNSYTLPLYTDPGGAAAVTYGLTGVPETYIVDKKGILRKKIIGPATFDAPDPVAFFTRLLAEGS